MSRVSPLEVISFAPRSVKFPSPWLGHVPFAAWLIRAAAPRVFVELGTHSGNSYFAFCQSVAEGGLSTECHAVDTWKGDDHAGDYGDEVFAQVSAYNDANYAQFSQLLRMTFDEAAHSFEDRSIDLLHIDGLHTYEAVSHDFETWLPKLSDRAIVLFHDTAVRERGFGVWRLWEELVQRYPNVHFDHSYGLGVLFVGKEQPAAMQELIAEWTTPEGEAAFRQYFTVLGQRIEFEWQIGHLNQALLERDRDIARLTQIAAERDYLVRTVAEMRDSTSWRITAPMRFAMRHLKRIAK